jgi:1,4-dihydroxy-2-naphthoate octaprenyltransferase
VTAPSAWLAGARPRTLPAAIAPVLVGTGAAAATGEANLARALLALVVALALQVGVNYANDYSDGIRGTDDARVGPMRLVGSGTASPTAVLRAAWLSFGIAAIAGLILVVLTEQWWLLALGAAAIAAAWYYTGGSRPYGYSGLGELSVFVFFGLVATAGTAYVQAERITPSAVVGAVAIGALACAILLANNLRDIPTDAEAGKRTLAVRLGAARTRVLFVALIALAYLLAIALAVGGRRWAALALLSAPLAIRAALPVLRRAGGRDLIPVLRDTGLTELLYAGSLALGLALS